MVLSTLRPVGLKVDKTMIRLVPTLRLIESADTGTSTVLASTILVCRVHLCFDCITRHGKILAII